MVCVHCPSGMHSACVDETKIILSDIPNDVVEKLIEEGDIYDSSGGIMIEHELVKPFVLSVEGGFDTVLGLSKKSVKRVLIETWMKITE